MSGAFTQDDLVAVNEAIRQLVQGKRRVSVTVAGRSTTYKDVDLSDLRRLRVEIRNEINRGKSRSILVKSRKGL